MTGRIDDQEIAQRTAGCRLLGGNRHSPMGRLNFCSPRCGAKMLEYLHSEYIIMIGSKTPSLILREKASSGYLTCPLRGN